MSENTEKMLEIKDLKIQWDRYLKEREKKGYLYRLEEDGIKIKCYEGKVKNSIYKQDSEKDFFITKDKTFRCSSEQGVVDNSCIWFKERKDHLAIKLLLEIDVFDYWWTGTDVSPLEAEAPDLTNYYTKNR